MSEVEGAPSEAVVLQMLDAHVAVVTIQRPEARNAINGAVTQELGRLVEVLDANPEVRAVILTGAGTKAFCTGADIKELAAGKGTSLATEKGGFAGFVNYRRAKPWIAAVEGFALGGGFEIVLACDMVVAASDATFGLPETTRGLLAAAGGAYRLPRLLPRNIAIELIATGARMSATRAYELGFVNRLAHNGAAVTSASELAAGICANAPVAVQESLSLARASADLDEATLRKATSEAQARIIQTADAREGTRAFIEKRAPKWVGR
jgi:enoyl-CoA hydratase/carnithine racemase